MSKYNPEELKEMAKTVIGAKRSNDFRYLEFVMSASVKAGVDPAFVERKIYEYANSAV